MCVSWGQTWIVAHESHQILLMGKGRDGWVGKMEQSFFHLLYLRLLKVILKMFKEGSKARGFCYPPTPSLLPGIFPMENVALLKDTTVEAQYLAPSIQQIY